MTKTLCLLSVHCLLLAAFAAHADRRDDENRGSDRQPWHGADRDADRGEHGDARRDFERNTDNLPATLTLTLPYRNIEQGISLAALLREQYPFVTQRELRITRVEVSGDAANANAVIELRARDWQSNHQRFERNRTTQFDVPNLPVDDLTLTGHGALRLDRAVLTVASAARRDEDRGHDRDRDHRRDHDEPFDDAHAVWRSLGTFRTSSDHDRDTAVDVPAAARRLHLVAIKRSTVIQQAVLVYADGQRRELPELSRKFEGGEQAFAWVKRRDPMAAVLHLRTAPGNDGKRGYVEVFCTP